MSADESEQQLDPITRSTKHLTGNAALYMVAYRLSLMGWTVIPTARNSPGPDLLIVDGYGKKQTVQVKGIRKPRRKGNDWIGGANKAETSGCDWWIVMRNVGEGPGQEEFFILTPEEVAAGRNEHGWSNPDPRYRNTWDRIGNAPGVAFE